MKIPAEPQVGAVISYSYLWADEATDGRQEGSKDRPAAIVMARADLGPSPVAYVLPITHVPPVESSDPRRMEIPPTIKSHLGLDEAPSWVVVDELNVFVWPGFDLRPVPASDPATCLYGILPRGFFLALRSKMLAHAGRQSLRVVKRGE